MSLPSVKERARIPSSLVVISNLLLLTSTSRSNISSAAGNSNKSITRGSELASSDNNEFPIAMYILPSSGWIAVAIISIE